jgi:hypothetical protein
MVSSRAGSAVRWLRLAFGVFLLLVQVVMIVYARFSDVRYFSWAPHDVMWAYQITVDLDDTQLTDREANQRYRLQRYKYHEHAIEHVMIAIRQYESTYGIGDNASVTLVYSKNGGTERQWNWPE